MRDYSAEQRLQHFRREAQRIVGELQAATEITDLLVDRYYRGGLTDMEQYARRLQRVTVAAATLCQHLINESANRIVTQVEYDDSLAEVEHPDDEAA